VKEFQILDGPCSRTEELMIMFRVMRDNVNGPFDLKPTRKPSRWLGEREWRIDGVRR
jgi:hypothetical protein